MANNSNNSNSYPPFVYDPSNTDDDEEDQREKHEKHIEHLKLRNSLRKKATNYKDVVMKFIKDKEAETGVSFLLQYHFYSSYSYNNSNNSNKPDKYCDLTMRLLHEEPDFNGILKRKHKLFIIRKLKEYNEENRDSGECENALYDWEEDVESE
jgi:hypothetical protein